MYSIQYTVYNILVRKIVYNVQNTVYKNICLSRVQRIQFLRPVGGFYLVLRLLCAQRRFEKIFMGIRPQLSMRIMNWLTPTSDFC